MKRTKHLVRMILGCLAYHTVARLSPSLWAYEDSLFWGLLPTMGYFAYHPKHLHWWQYSDEEGGAQ